MMQNHHLIHQPPLPFFGWDSPLHHPECRESSANLVTACLVTRVSRTTKRDVCLPKRWADELHAGLCGMRPLKHGLTE